MPEVNVPIIPGQVSAVAAGVNPPQSTAYKIADIVSMARGAQEYQKEKELLPYAIEAGKAQSEKTQLDLAKSQLAISGGALTGLENSPALRSGDIKKVREELNMTEKWISSLGVPITQDGAMAQAKALVEAGDLNGYQNFLGNLRKQLVSSSEQFAAGQPQLTTAGGQPALFTPATGEITQPQIGGGQPMSMAPQGQPTGVTPQQMSQPYGGGQQPSGMRLNFPVRPAGDVRPFAPGEADEIAAGQKYVQGLNDFGINAVSYKRNVDEAIAEAKKIEKEAPFTSGLAGAAYRKTAQALGDESYIQLNKDLANVQIAALKAAGADLQTDAGKQLIRMANGDATFPPNVLINIAERTKAEITNIELQRQAANKFYQRYGTNNMGSFKQAWADNADSKVFQAMNIYRDENLNGDEKKAMIDKLLGKNEADRKSFYQKYQNLNKLVNTGGL